LKSDVALPVLEVHIHAAIIAKAAKFSEQQLAVQLLSIVDTLSTIVTMKVFRVPVNWWQTC
jgi:hypothetical protein